MTATPLTPERLREITALRDGDYGWFRSALTDLLAEITRLRSDLDHATAHDGDHLSKASRRMVDTVMGDRDALRLEVAKLRTTLESGNEAFRSVRETWKRNADHRDARIAALETGLREACELARKHLECEIPFPEDADRAALDRLSALAGGIQSKETT